MNTLLILLFILLSCFIYFISSPSILISLFLISLLSIYLLKINFKGGKTIFLFLSLTIFINFFFLGIKESLFIGIRIFTIYLVTLFMNQYMSTKEIASSIANLFFFLKQKKEIEIILALSLSMIPIFIEEITNIKKVFISKNFKFNFKNGLKNSSIFLSTFLNNLFKRMEELENVLISRNYK